MGAIELIAYPYWCIEKGYARFTGIRERTEAWRTRAEGWIKVMGTDVLTSCVIYTFATIAFYFLGAGVLSGMGLVPKGLDMVRTLSHMFTQTLGNWSFYLFLIGSMAVLYSTVFFRDRRPEPHVGRLRRHARLVRQRGLRRQVRGDSTPGGRAAVDPHAAVPVPAGAGGHDQGQRNQPGPCCCPASALPSSTSAKPYLPPEIAPKGWITTALWGSTLVMALLMGYSVIHALLRW